MLKNFLYAVDFSSAITANPKRLTVMGDDLPETECLPILELAHFEDPAARAVRAEFRSTYCLVRLS